MGLARATGSSCGSMLRRLAGGNPDAARRGAAVAAAACLLRPTQLASANPRSASTRAPMPTNVHLFHTSTPRPAGRRRKRFSNVRAAEMGLVDEEKVDQFSEKHFAKYTAEETKQLERKYTAAQMAAVAAGEEAVDPRDLAVQGRLREDGSTPGLEYLDDFAKLTPGIDHRPRRPLLSYDPATTAPEDLPALDMRLMDDAAFGDDLMQWVRSRMPAEDAMKLDQLPQAERDALLEAHGPSDEEVVSWYTDRSVLTQRDGKTPLTSAAEGASSIVGRLPEHMLASEGSHRRATDPEDDGLDENGDYTQMKRLSGLKVQEILNEIATKTLLVRFVANQTRLGKVQSASIVAIAGNGKGRLGLGIAKSTDFEEALIKAKSRAVLNMRPIRRYEDRTIYGNVEAKVSATVVKLSARPPGFGLRVSHRIFEMARAAGISDLAARIPRSRNPFNTIMATYKALTNQPDPEQIAIGRGKKLVDVRKVYYGGAVY